VSMIRRFLLRLPASRAVREQQLIEQSILKIATMWNAYGPSSYERMRSACLTVAALYPEPTHRTLERLFEDMATSQPTDLALAFYNQYCSRER
jgi:hypothetical protein